MKIIKTPPKACYLMELPVELRTRILQLTDLVVRPRPHLQDYSAELNFIDGRFQLADLWPKHRNQCTPAKPCDHFLFASPLFLTCRQLSWEAREVYLSSNILRFSDDPALTLERFFRPQPRQLLQRIRHIEFVLYDNDLFQLAYRRERVRPVWDALVSFIAQNLDVGNLVVSIDAGFPYDDWIVQPIGWESLVYVLDAFAELTKSLLRLRGLRSFFVYMPVFHRVEAMMEKAVMGLNYDSAALGRLPVAKRHP